MLGYLFLSLCLLQVHTLLSIGIICILFFLGKWCFSIDFEHVKQRLSTISIPLLITLVLLSDLCALPITLWLFQRLMDSFSIVHQELHIWIFISCLLVPVLGKAIALKKTSK